MLLRRITKHVTDQNWFAVFIDFFIVVVGVFIGIQVANWNAERLEAEREQEVLVAILDDLLLDLNLLESASAMAKLNIDTSNYMLEQTGFNPLNKISIPVANSSLIGQELTLTPQQSIPEEQKDQLWKLITVHFYPIQSNTAFSSLIAAGDLKIISNQDLISNLQSYTQHWNSLRDSNITTYKKFRDRTIFVGHEFGLSPFSKIPEKELNGIIKENPKLRAVLRTLLEYTVIHKAQFEQTKNQTMMLIDKIEKEIK